MIGPLREWAYRKSLLRTVELPAFVLSIGNISMGGTGKSALAMWLAEWACARRIPTAVLSRGYKRKTGALRIVPAHAALPDAEEVGDEPWMIKHRAPGVSLLVHADRARMAERHWRELGEPKLVLLDDAFQHWRAARDCDVLMVDATESLEQRALPFGKLRETVRAARRADLIVVTRARAVSAERLASVIARLEAASRPRQQPLWKRATRPEALVVAADYQCDGFLDAATGQACELPRDRELVLVSGIAKPDHLRAVARAADAPVVEEIYFPDHHRLTDADRRQVLAALRGLRGGALLVTEKDWGRWRELFAEGVPAYVMRVRFEFLGQGETVMRKFLEEVAGRAGCSTLP